MKWKVSEGTSTMSVVKSIELSKNDFSSTDEKLAAYIVEHLEEIPTLTTNTLAQLTSTSAAAVIRFSKKLGFVKFSEFKLALIKDIETRVYQEHNNLQLEDSFHTAKSKILRNDQLLIEAVGHIIDETVIELCVNHLIESKNIYVYGVGTSVLAAEDIRQKWTKLGKTVIFDKDRHLLKQQMENDQEPGLFIGISNSGKNKDVLSLVKHAKNHGFITIGLTQLGPNNLAKKVDIPLQTGRTEDIKNGHYGSGATHSILLQIVTIDLLFYFYLRQISCSSNHRESKKDVSSEFTAK